MKQSHVVLFCTTSGISVLVLIVAANTTSLSQWIILSAWIALGVSLFFLLQRVPTGFQVLCAGIVYVLAFPFSKSSQTAFAHTLNQPSFNNLIYLVRSKAFLVGVISYFAFLCQSCNNDLKQAQRESEQSERNVKYLAGKLSDCENHLKIESDERSL